jgi:NADH:ubiquinone oxidoreductase subunit E
MFPSPPAPDVRTDALIQALVRRQGGRAGALIEVLHQVQEHLGHLPPSALRQVARGLQLPLSHVYGVASFYHLFQLEAPSTHRCAVCLGTACFVRGSMELVQRLQARLGVRLDDPDGGGGWVLQGISCLGACGLGPLLLLDGVLVAGRPLASPELLEARFKGLGLPLPRRDQP